MEEIWESEEEDEQFELKQIVWAKIIGYPWWPARITQIPSRSNPHYRVDFFVDNTHAFLPPNKLCTYEHMRCDIDLHRHMNKGLRKAVLAADRAIGEKTASRGRPRASHSAVEGPSLALKQLLKSPQATTPLQENNQLHPRAQQPEESSSSFQQPIEEEESEPPRPKYSRDQRVKYVNNLLKKYKLINIPKLTQPSHSPQKVIQKQYNHSKRRNISKKVENKTKGISKFPPQEHSYLYLLSRKIYSLLKEKEGLSSSQRKQISSSLARNVLGGGGLQEVSGVLKWVMISPSETISNYYESWGCLQGQKEKNSNITMANEELS